MEWQPSFHRDMVWEFLEFSNSLNFKITSCAFTLCANVSSKKFNSSEDMICIAEYRSLASRAATKSAIPCCNGACGPRCNNSSGVSPISRVVGASIKTLSSTLVVFTTGFHKVQQAWYSGGFIALCL